METILFSTQTLGETVKREFYYQDDRSNKFWTIELDGCSYVTRNGRVGTTGRETRKLFDTEDEAQRQFDKQIASKLKKGYKEGTPPEYAAPDWESMSMSEDVFWRIIQLFNWKRSGDDDAVIAPAVNALSKMSTGDIEQFQEILAEKLFALDTEAHAREIGEEAYRPGGYLSADWFLYVRCCAVANGPAFYGDALKSPKDMPKDLEFEAILSVGPDAHEKKTGDELDYLTKVSYESFSNQKGWADVKD